MQARMERSARAWWLPESRRAPRRVPGSPPQNAAVADAARETVRVEPLEQELGVTSAGAREIAKASERDLARAPAPRATPARTPTSPRAEDPRARRRADAEASP